MQTTSANSLPARGPAHREMWYVPDRRIQTQAAARNAAEVAEWVITKQGLETEPDNRALFTAWHVCAYQAALGAQGRPEAVAERERESWCRRWRDIREYIVEQNLGLAYSMLGRFGSRHMDEDTLQSEAMLALSKAVDRFNPWRGYEFSTYACNVIARALMRHRERESNYRRLFPFQHDASYERPDRMPDTQTELLVERLRQVLDCRLGDLTDLETKILSHRFPMQFEPTLTFREIGEAIGFSKERVRQVQNRALGKLRAILEADPILR